MTFTDPAAAREQARRRAGQLRNFYIHIVVFVVGNLAAFLINWMTLSSGDNPWWFQWGLLVWSVALAVHGVTVVGRNSWLGPSWEQRKIAQYLQADEAPAGASSSAPTGPAATRPAVNDRAGVTTEDGHEALMFDAGIRDRRLGR